MLTDVNFMTKRVGHQIYRCCRHLSALPSQPPPPLPRVVVETEELVVHSLPVTPLDMNQYLLGCKQKKKAVLIDCGCEWPDRWVRTAAQSGMTITALLQTHGHVDHICGLQATKELLPEAPIYAHPADWYIYKSAPIQGLLFGLACPVPPSRDRDALDGDELQVGLLTVKVRHSPGHSPGHVTFLVTPPPPSPGAAAGAHSSISTDSDSDAHRDRHSGRDSGSAVTPSPPRSYLFSGDLICEGSIGRTDFPGCSHRDMCRSLAGLAELSRDTVLLPGHGGLTSLGREWDTNPFLQDI